ncbi:MAG: hypothetical protein IPO88_27750 [Nannocystis sp.]|uniref:hypothetical protein n=1 Tax=Nannocystis sp. TaxID=1962667 RepID=UPI00242986FD|nr:hypothetical protein [Nannocystis sp.]MBK9757224.1 hypothetical protein [Nannocystis sp.]
MHAAPVPDPSVPITPAVAPEEVAPVVTPAVGGGGETLPEPRPPVPTPTPAPYAGVRSPTAPPTAPGAPPTAPGAQLGPPPGTAGPQPYPTPGAEPRPGVDLGGMSVTPLPPPPAALDPQTIRRQPWRGRYWIGLRVGLTGPLGGERPAAPSVLSLLGGADIGWRVGNVLGLGMGISGNIQNRVRLTVTDPYTGSQVQQTHNGRMLYWDALFVRLHLPLKKRFQPYADLGGGLARLARGEGGRSYGAQMRAAIGIEGWVSSTVTMGFAGVYRLNAIHDVQEGGQGWIVGHAMQGVFDVGFHW